jgi:arylformamidase
MKIYDITIPITPSMVVWPGDPPVNLQRLSSIDKGDTSNVSQICMSVHTGTHIDAPEHFIDKSKTIENIPLDKLVGKALVLEINDQTGVINEKVLMSHPQKEALLTCKKLLFKTKNSRLWETSHDQFDEQYVGIDSSGASFLAKLNLDLIGVDYLSISTFNDTEIPHQILLDREIVLLEGINLQNVPPGSYDLYCLPLPIEGSDGAPARTILIDPKF